MFSDSRACQFQVRKKIHWLAVTVCSICIATLAYAQQSMLTPAVTTGIDLSPNTVTLHMLSGISSTEQAFAMLSPNHRYIAVLDSGDRLSVYPITSTMDTLAPIQVTQPPTFLVQEYAWAGTVLLISGIPNVTTMDLDLNIALENQAELRVWKPGDNSPQRLLPYGASAILPDHAGVNVALFNRTIDPPLTMVSNNHVTIFNMKTNKEITTLEYPSNGAIPSMSFPVTWAKDDKTLFFISTKLITDEGKPCPTLFSLDLKGNIRQLTRMWVNVNQVKEPLLFTHKRWGFHCLATADDTADIVGILGGVPFPHLRIGFFNAKSMIKDVAVSDANLPDIWKRRWKSSALWTFTITPDGYHIIFQDTDDKIVAADGCECYPMYSWNLQTGELIKIGKCPMINRAFGWVGEMLLFTTLAQKVNIDGHDEKWAAYIGIISIKGTTEAKK